MISSKILILSAPTLSVVKVKLLSEMSNKALFTGTSVIPQNLRGPGPWMTLTHEEPSTKRKPDESYPD